MSIPLQSTLPRTHRVKDVTRETELVTTLTFEGSLGAKPGQCVMAWVPGVDEFPLGVSFDDGAVTKITFFRIGKGSEVLGEKKAGDLVGLRGPFGTHFTWHPGEHIILVAGGYGAAPLRFVAHEASRQGCTIELIIGAKDKNSLLFLEEFQGMPNLALHIATNDGSEGFSGFNTELFEKLLTSCPWDPAKRDEPGCQPVDQVFACGPEPMLQRVYDVAGRYKIPVQMTMARYMKCAMGLCGSCCVDPLGIRLCVEGPVLKGEVLAQLAEFGAYYRDDLGRKKEYLRG